MKYRLYGKKDTGWYIPEYVAYVTLMTSFVFNIISMIMGSYILWTGSNPFGIILFFGIVAFCASRWILRPFWKMTVRHFGGKLQPIDTARLSVLHWLTNYYRKKQS